MPARGDWGESNSFPLLLLGLSQLEAQHKVLDLQDREVSQQGLSHRLSWALSPGGN